MRDTEYVRAITKLTDRDHERLMAYFAELMPEERISVHSLHTKIMQKKSHQRDASRLPAFQHATFILAVRQYKTSKNSSTPPGRLTMKEAATIQSLRNTHRSAKAPRKTSPQQLLVERYYEEIEKQRGKEPKPETWRAITLSIASESGQSISHTALKNIFERLNGDGGPHTGRDNSR